MASARIGSELPDMFVNTTGNAPKGVSEEGNGKPMAVIINLNARLAERRPIAPIEGLPEEGAEILVFTGIRYEIRDEDQESLTADRSGNGKR